MTHCVVTAGVQKHVRLRRRPAKLKLEMKLIPNISVPVYLHVNKTFTLKGEIFAVGALPRNVLFSRGSNFEVEGKCFISRFQARTPVSQGLILRNLKIILLKTSNIVTLICKIHCRWLGWCKTNTP